ncbi:MAG: LUD domain-containing protein [Chloroflexi bacterium]|nr:LUD domain-containing protein [Chloroflexota bacterium]
MIADFKERYERAVSDPDLRPRLLAFQRSWRQSRDAQVARLEQRTERSFDDLRRDFAAVKDSTIERLDDYIDEFRANAEAAGATVVELTTAEEAVEYIAGVCTARGIDLVVKSKSMVSEEIELNDELAERGITAIETDLGEWLLQLAEQRPSHLVMPAIHQKRQYVADILGKELGREFDPDNIPAMVASAREGLRRHYLAAGAGLTGANALVAETGSIMVVTNEGNMRLATSLPDVHFVTAGIEKLIPSWADAERQLQLLPRSATAQTLSTYTTCITGAQPGKEMHIILLDNGRREMRGDDMIGAALRCIRCGACANVCPPYQVVGGHTFGHIYTGAIGLVNTTFHHSIEDAAGPQGLCVSCGACETVCPVAIPLPRQILNVRRRATESGHAPRWERWLLRAWSMPQLFRAAMKLGAVASTAARAVGLVHRDHIRLPMSRRLSWRSVPAIPAQTGSDLIGDRRPQPTLASTPAAGTTVDLFAQCLANRLMPDTVDASARLIEAGGANVNLPPNQHCCGLPAFDAGDWDTARTMARSSIEVLGRTDHEIVTPATSCVISMRDHWPQLFRDEPDTLSRANAVADRIHDLAAWLDGPGRLPDGCLERRVSGSWTAHRFCQSSNRNDPGARIDLLVERLTGETSLPLEEPEVCCGFGGLTSIAAPEVGQGILERKLDCVAASGCETLLTNNPGCALHLRAGAVARGASHDTQHYADYLAARLPDNPPS